MSERRNNPAPAVEPVQVIAKTISIIEALARNGEMRISELSGETRLTKSLVYRFVRTLVHKGYVQQNRENDKYALTLRMFEIGSAALGRSDVLTAAKCVAEKVARSTREAVHVAVLEQRDIIFVDTAASSHALTMWPRIGGRNPAYCTALGRALLAGHSDGEIEDLYRGVPLKPRTDKTVTDLRELIRLIRQVREDGIAVDREEFEDGLICVATPLRDHSGSITAAMAMAAPRFRLPDARIADAVTTMKSAGEQVGRMTAGHAAEDAPIDGPSPCEVDEPPSRRRSRGDYSRRVDVSRRN